MDRFSGPDVPVAFVVQLGRLDLLRLIWIYPPTSHRRPSHLCDLRGKTNCLPFNVSKIFLGFLSLFFIFLIYSSGTDTEFYFPDLRSQRLTRAKSGPFRDQFWYFSRLLVIILGKKSGPLWNLGSDPDQVRNYGPYRSHCL